MGASKLKMRLMIKKFGEILISRPDGREAFLVARAYILPKSNEEIILDFQNVKVLTPSWADEFVTGLIQLKKKIKFENVENPSVQATLKILNLN